MFRVSEDQNKYIFTAMKNELKKRAVRNVRFGLSCLGCLALLVLGGGSKQPSQAQEALRVRYRVLEPAATPTVTPTATPTPAVLQEIEQFGQETFKSDWPMFKKIIRCESGFDPKAKSKTSDYGLGQINQCHKIAPKWLYNWKINLLVMKQLFDEHGNLSPWRYSKHCWQPNL